MNAEEIGRALGGKRSGRQWKCKCPAHEDSTPSLIVFDGRSEVQVRCMAGCSPLDVITALRKRNLWKNGTVSHETNDSIADPNPNGPLALRIWEEAKNPRNTLAEMYLADRHLVLPEKTAMEVLRFHPRCPRGGNGGQPALIALMRQVTTHEPVAIQRIFLTADARKECAMMLGPAGGAAMMLTGKFDTFWDDLLYCPRLHICEGLETGIALMGKGVKPIWALGSAGAIQRFPVLYAVGSLVVCADNDKAGETAAYECMERWEAAGIPTFQHTPEKADEDFADLTDDA